MDELEKWVEEKETQERWTDVKEVRFWLSAFAKLLEKRASQYSTVGDHRGYAQAFDEIKKEFGLEVGE